MSSENRRVKRRRVVKLGKIIYGISDITIDCLISDETAYGVLVETETPIVVPEEVKIRLVNGGIFPAICRWEMGNKKGFEFIGAREKTNAIFESMQDINDILQIHGVSQAVLSLRRSNFFDNDELRRAADDAEAAIMRLKRLLLEK